MWIDWNKFYPDSDTEGEEDYLLFEEYLFKDNTSCCTIKEVRQGCDRNFYSASVYSSCGTDCCFISDYDLELLKLKCLIKAKEFGWDIKNINIDRGI